MSTDQQHDDKGLKPDQQPGETDLEATGEQEVPADAGSAGQEELEALREKLLLAHADMQNVRRRAERDVEQARKFALERFVGDLLSVVDNLERALDSADRSNDAGQSLLEGVELTLKGFLEVLRRFNVEQLDPKGEPFNPEHHEAMAMVPSADVAPNCVVEVFQKGYLLNGRLVRPARVVVARKEGEN